MDFKKISKPNSPFARVLSQGLLWQSMTEELRRLLPKNLATYFQVAYIHDNKLMLFVNNNTAASRLRMIVPSVCHQLSYADEFNEIKVRLMPDNTHERTPTQREMTAYARKLLAQTAKNLQHHEKLADVLDYWSNLKKEHKK